MNKNTYCVYMHKNKINGKIYVGQTKYGDDPNKRWYYGKHYGGEFKNDIDKYGWDEFEHIIVKQNLSLQEADILEKELITYYMNQNNCYNRRIAGNNNNEQTIQKLSESVSKSLQGHKVSEETKEKIRIAGISKKASEQTKQKMSISHSKKIWVNDGNKSLLIDNEDLDVYLNKGYTRGRNDLNKIWVNKDNNTKRIDISELDYYISLGFVKGRK